MMNKSLTEIEEGLTKEVVHIAHTSYLEGSINTLESLKKAFSIFGETKLILLDMVLDSIDSLHKEQQERLEGIKKLHDRPET